MTINEKIKKLRLDHNMTQEDLAKVCFVTRNAVSKWENNKGYPNIDSMKSICEHFNITMDDLLSNDDIKELTLSTLKEHKKLRKKFTILAIALFSTLYFLLVIVLRMIIFNYDPTAGFAWYLLFAPICVMLIGILCGITFERCRNALIPGAIGFVITLIADIIKSGFSLDNIILNAVYLFIFFVIVLITFSIKLGRHNLSNKNVNKILSIIIFVITITLFVILLSRSIYYERNDIDPGYIGPFNLVPLFYILIFMIPYILEIFWIIISFMKKNKD